MPASTGSPNGGSHIAQLYPDDGFVPAPDGKEIVHLADLAEVPDPGLERDRLVHRTDHPEVPPRVEYEISELGRSLGPLFAHLSEWATTNLEHIEQARRRYDDAQSSGGG